MTAAKRQPKTAPEPAQAAQQESRIPIPAAMAARLTKRNQDYMRARAELMADIDLAHELTGAPANAQAVPLDDGSWVFVGYVEPERDE